MALSYPTQIAIPLIGSKSSAGTITPIALKSYYDFSGVSKTLPTGGMSKIELLGRYKAGAGETANSVQIIVEASHDRVNWFRLLNESASGGTSTITQKEFTIAQSTDSGTLAYDAQSANFTVGLKVTGGTSGATGYIEADTDAGTEGVLTLSNITGTFQNNEAITDSGTGAATVDGILTSITTFSIPLDISNKFHRISVKESGVSAVAGTIFIEAVVSGQ